MRVWIQILILLLSSVAHADDLKVIRSNLIQDLFSMVPASNRAQWASKEIRAWMTDESADGRFTDIDYLDSQSMNWGPLTAISRANVMIMAVQLPENRFYRDQKVEDAAQRAIRFVAQGSWWNYNWWTLEIGMPLTAYKILLLEGEKLDPLSFQFLMSATRQGHIVDHPSGWPADGQNLIWFSEITIALGVLYQRPDWVKIAVNAISTTLALDQEQGIQADFSFHQHGDLLYSGGYGLDFARDSARMFRILSGTSFTFSPNNYDALSSYILDGELWLLHGKSLDYSSMGRYYARAGSSHTQALDTTCALMSKTFGPRQNEFRDCAQKLSDGEVNLRQGNRFFWRSDFMTHNRSKFGFSLRMSSLRTLTGDTSPNGEGLKSHYLADGLTYLYRNGDEYYNIHPVWDFNRLPGVTAEYRDTYPSVPNNNYAPTYGTTNFVGGVSDGNFGAAAMEFKRKSIRAKKAWFFYDRGMIALGAEIESDGKMPIYTSLNQEWSETPIQYALGDAPTTTQSLDNGVIRNQHIAWANANSVGYLFLADNSSTFQAVDQQGSWNTLAGQLSAEPVRGKVTSLWIEHFPGSNLNQYAYAVLPNLTAGETLVEWLAPDFKVVSNNSEIQAVEWPGQKMLQAIFYRPSKLTWNNGQSSLEVDHACAILLQATSGKTTLSLSSPDQQSAATTVQWSIDRQPLRSTTIHLPGGVDAGKSVSVTVE